MEPQMKSKKKFWKPPSFEDFNLPLPSKKIKLDSESFIEDKPQEVPNEANTPKEISELAIHPKKIEEVRNWIKWSLKQKAPMLLITGPAGTGKTTTLKVSASEEGVSVKEWINPMDKIEFKGESVLQNEVYDRYNFSESRQTDKFEEFVFQSSRYKSLFDEKLNVLILIEDFPNIFIWRPKLFHDFLKKYENHGRSPIVFILTDDPNLNLCNNLFPSQIKSKFNITNIKFNPVNHSSLLKNLKALSEFYCSEKVSSQFLENIIKNANGDLRSATNDLLLFLRTSSPSTNNLSKKKKSKKTNGLGAEVTPLSLKDSNFDFYHTLGRILYPKLKPEKEKSDCKNTKQVLLHDVQKIAESWSPSFLGILHENYLQTFTKIKDIVEGANCLGLCDVLGHNQELEEYVSLIGVITLMLKNTEPKKTGFNPIKGSFKIESNNANSEKSEEVFHNHQISRRDFLLDVNPFLKILNEKNTYKFDFQKIEIYDESDDDLIEIEEVDD